MEYDPFASPDHDETLVGKNIPKILEQYSPDDLADPNSVIEIIEVLQEELETVGKRNPKNARNASEGLEYIYEIFPEFRDDGKKELSVDMPDDYGQQSFSGSSIDERLDWIAAVHDVWSNKQKEDDSCVEVVENPKGDGYALKHDNEELGHVKESGNDHKSGDIAVFDSKAEASREIEDKNLTDTTLSDEDKKDENKVVEKFKFKRQLTIFDAIDFVNGATTDVDEQKREGFSAKALDILDKEKKWPKLGTEPISGWVAMESAVEQGFTGSKSDNKYQLTQENAEVSIRVKKAEFDYFSRLEIQLPSTREVTDTKEADAPEKTKNELLVEIGRKSFPALKLTEKDAVSAGTTVKLVKDGALNNNDWVFFCNHLKEQYVVSKDAENVETAVSEDSKNPKHDGFSVKGLEILDGEKRWPKLDKDKQMSGWQAMETAAEQGFESQQNDHPKVYLIKSSDGEQSIRLKKVEFDYFNSIAQEQKQEQGQDEKDEHQQKINSLLVTPWPDANHDIEKYRVIFENTKSSTHKKVLQDVISELEGHLDDATKQMKEHGFVDGTLGSSFISLPSKFSFTKELTKNNGDRIARGPSGAVYELNLTSTEQQESTFEVKIHHNDGTVYSLGALEKEKTWNLPKALDVAVKDAGYPELEISHTSKDRPESIQDTPSQKMQEIKEPLPAANFEEQQIHQMPFKTFLSEVHGIDADRPNISDDKNKQMILLLHQWGGAIAEALSKDKEVPQKNIDALRGAMDRNLIELSGPQPAVLQKVTDSQDVKSVDQDTVEPQETTEDKHYQYGVKHPRGVGLGASPEGHIAYESESEKYPGGIVTYPQSLSESDISHYEYEFLGVVPNASTPEKQEQVSAAVFETTQDTPPKAFELTKKEFSDVVGDINYPKPDMVAYVLTHYADKDKEKVDGMVAQGEYSSVKDYIHEQVIIDAVNMRLSVPWKVLADYPAIDIPLPEPWELTQKEFLNKAGSFQKKTDFSPNEFLTEVMTGSYHEKQVQKALDNGCDVPEKVISEYPDLQTQPSLAM